jgi:hypothetical protein
MQDKQNENTEIKVIFQQFFFLAVFRHFSVSEYYKYSKAARNIVRFTTSMTNSAKGCGPVSGFPGGQ